MAALLKNTAPHLRTEWDATKNAEERLYFDTISSTATKRVWWCCSKNPRHRWRSLVRDRANGRGCPYCFGLLVLPEDSLGHLFPGICAEIDPIKNPGFDPNVISPGSKTEIWWKCSKSESHSWKRAIRYRTKKDQGCPHCRTESHSLAQIAPDVAADWHSEKNYPRTPTSVHAHSRLKVWWICSINPEHIWEAQIRSRVTGNSKCPRCQKTKGFAHLPPLSEFNPELSKQWHPTKNGTLTPSQVTAGTQRKVWWQCPNNPSHEWDAAVRNRARLGRGCPFCTPRTARVASGQSLADKFPNLASQWHPEKNEDLRPSGFLPGSAVRVWWRCSADRPHEWEASIYNRTSRQPNGECPFCRKTRLSESNCLKSVHPEVAAEWHPVLNGSLSPSDVSRASGKRVWWQCSKNPAHEWDTIVRARTLHKSGCPHCDLENRSARMQQALLEAAHSNANSLKTFKNHLRSVRTLANQIKPASTTLNQAFYRMIYASVITALETYLADTFYREVITSQKLTEKLLTTTPEFLEKKYAVTEVIDWQKNLTKRLGEYFYGIAWHNLGKVRPMYETVLNVTFPAEYSELCRAVAIRHDIVHRNGRTKDHRVHRLSKHDLEKLASVAEEFVKQIENQIRP